MKGSSRNTLSGNLYFQYELKNLKFQNDLTISYNKNKNSPYGSFSEYSLANPIYTPYDDEGHIKKQLVELYPRPPGLRIRLVIRFTMRRCLLGMMVVTRISRITLP